VRLSLLTYLNHVLCYAFKTNPNPTTGLLVSKLPALGGTLQGLTLSQIR
jgi:hypothetical protein